MSYLGSWKIDDLLTFYAVTTRFDTGAATDADSVPSYRVYEDETGTAILTGTMALLDSSNTAGFYSEQITLSAANGFEKGKSYAVYIQATVNSVVGATHHTLQIEAEVDANTVSPATVDANVTKFGGSNGTFSSGRPEVNTSHIAGSAVSTSSAQIGVNVVNLGGSAVDATSGLINANVKQISGDATAADNEESFFDGTGYAGTNNVIPTVTTVTNTVKISTGTGAGQLDITSGVVNSNMTQIDGLATNGNNATLYLKQLNVQQSDNYENAVFITGGLGGDAVFIRGGAYAEDDVPGGTGVLIRGGVGGNEVSENAGAGLVIQAGADGGIGGNDAVTLNGTGSGKSINAPNDVTVSDGDLTLAAIASAVWAAATRTLTAISDSAGITTLLTRIGSALNISSGKVESNVKQINDTNITGDGSGTPWGPA